MHLAALPPTAASRNTTSGAGVPWQVGDELLALILEELSVMTSDRRRPEPLSIPRPGQPDRPASGGKSIDELFNRAAMGGRVKVVDPGG